MTKEQQIVNDYQKIIHDGIYATRKKLLDLSGRNRLLNFKHSGSKLLRFVDKSPNFIYSELMSSAESDKKGVLITPIPLPRKSDYPDIEIKDLKKIDVKEHARKLDINIVYEMPALLDVNSNGNNLNHDDKLQTLLYPEDLDRVSRRIQSEARTAIEETGINMLFLSLGFLKWNDREDSRSFNHAPLIMIPVEIERNKVDAKTGFAKFRIKYTGEDILDNICLREKLAQLSIEIPLFENFETPEKYFAALTEQIKDIKPEWEINRLITLSFLSFGKMLMYLDLDPKRWAVEEGITEAQHICDIFLGNNSGYDAIASEFDIDNDKKIPNITHVMDADSSQHSAIIDVLAGRNLVIEGPPGTGKSQTITNIIASCLLEGKTVLFASEKLAALQVVKKRLDSVGLGDFCLELHSNKTQKKAMLADLKKRLEMNDDSYKYAANNLDIRLHELNIKKASLIEYSNVINSTFGAMELTPHQIFWKTEILKHKCSNIYNTDIFIAPKETTKLTQTTLRENIEAIKNLSDNLTIYFSGNKYNKNHYWIGFNISGHIDYAKQQDIIKLLRKLREDAIKAVEISKKLSISELNNISQIITPATKEYKKDKQLFINNIAKLSIIDEIYNLKTLQTIKQAASIFSTIEKSELVDFIEKIEELISIQKKLKEEINFDALPNKAKILEIADKLNNTNIFSPLFKDWRGAREEFHKFSYNKTSTNYKNSAAILYNLIEYKKKIELLEYRAEYAHKYISPFWEYPGENETQLLDAIIAKLSRHS